MGDVSVCLPKPPLRTGEHLSAKSGMRRVLLTISYDGTAYVGWQRQLNGIAVQQRVEEALLALTGRAHARHRRQPHRRGRARDGAVRAFRHEIDHPRGPLSLCAQYAPAAGHQGDRRPGGGRASSTPGFDAVGKTYTYRIHNAPHPSALYRNYMAHVPVKLNLKAMNGRRLRDLFGTHDFAAFQAVGGTAKTTVRTLTHIDLNAEERAPDADRCRETRFYTIWCASSRVR